MAGQNFKITTPHAAVIVWNYDDRGGGPIPEFQSTKESQVVQQTVISTLSCLSISTNKSKSNPQGEFKLTLAPYKNWVSTITPGSWCALLMSQTPITQKDLKHANPSQVKMIGKISTVTVETSKDDTGTRRTQYSVTGVDWGYIFNNILYIDNFLSAPNDPTTQGTGIAVAIQNMLYNKDGLPAHNDTASNLRSLLGIFGKSLPDFSQQGNLINRLATPIYNFSIPTEMSKYFKFVGPNGLPSTTQAINNVLTLVTGSLTDEDTYSNISESRGYVDPFSLQGQHTFWQVLQDNSNPAMNEMISEIRWEDAGPRLTLYNRIKPFSFKNYDPNNISSYKGLRSFFQLVNSTDIADIDIISVSAGTNWNDKYNFVEIKPQFQIFEAFQNWIKRKAQKADHSAFAREGFRPLIAETKQWPARANSQPIGNTADSAFQAEVDFDQLTGWSNLLQEWFFNTHTMLSGTITIIGQDAYIGVGDNIKFNADLISPTPNMTSASVSAGTNNYLLAHVENISHSFTVSDAGARQFMTTIQFVRGIFVDSNNRPISQGTLDKFASASTTVQETNTTNIVSTSVLEDPDPQHVKGQ